LVNVIHKARWQTKDDFPILGRFVKDLSVQESLLGMMILPAILPIFAFLLKGIRTNFFKLTKYQLSEL